MGRQKIIKTGNSLAVTVPSSFVKMIGIKAGEEALAEVKPEEGRITYHFSGSKQLALAQNLMKRKRK
jgi:antitoxin component of MazEF toxin-antitoxin module